MRWPTSCGRTSGRARGDRGEATDRAATLVDAAVAGDRRALARLLTAVENRTPVAESALRRLYPTAGLGAPRRDHRTAGGGKSTLVAALIAALREAGRSVAVVAVDPSSPITGGALLGDRVRMQAYAADDGVFIRSMAARGHAGGLASTSASAAAVLDACGFDVVLLETVGTGQSEVEVAAAADTTVVLEAPEMGDEVQAIKAGLLEVADLVVVNKGDRPGAQRTAAQLRAMLVPTTARGPDRTRPPSAEASRGPRDDRVDRRGHPRAARGARSSSRGRPRRGERRRTSRTGRGPGRRHRPGPASGGASCAPRRHEGLSTRWPPTSLIRSPPPTDCWSWLGTDGAARPAARAARSCAVRRADDRPKAGSAGTLRR